MRTKQSQKSAPIHEHFLGGLGPPRYILWHLGPNPAHLSKLIFFSRRRRNSYPDSQVCDTPASSCCAALGGVSTKPPVPGCACPC